MNRSIKLLSLLLVVIMIFSMAACSKTAQPEAAPAAPASDASAPAAEAPKEKTTLNTAETTTPVYMDPARGTGENDMKVFVNVYENLVRVAKDGSPELWLAESYEVSDDALAYTFKLRSDVVFADGSPMTASDVKYSMDRFLTIGEGNAYIFNKVAETKIIDDYTVEFDLSEPFGPFVTALSCFFVVNEDLCKANTLAEGLYGENGDYATEWMVYNSAGSGPYICTSMTIDVDYTLEKNTNYWNPSIVNPASPDTVYAIKETEDANLKMQAGSSSLDLIHGHANTTTRAAILDSNATWQGGLLAQAGVNYFSYNTKKAPTDDVHIRKAISYATDLEQMLVIYNDMPKAYGPVPIGTFGASTTGLNDYSFNLDKAREEIAQSKYAADLANHPISVAYLNGSGDTDKLALLLAESLSSVGFTVEIVPYSWVLFCSDAGSPETSPNVTNLFVSQSYPEAGSSLEFKYASWTVGNYNQFEWVQDEKVDSMLKDAFATVDDAERVSIYQELQEYIVNDLVPSGYVFGKGVKPMWNTDSFTWPAGEGNTHALFFMNYYYADFAMK